jgi:hypothetical protein
MDGFGGSMPLYGNIGGIDLLGNTAPSLLHVSRKGERSANFRNHGDFDDKSRSQFHFL